MKSLVRPLEEPLFEKSSSLDYKKINNQPKEKKTMKKSQPDICCIFTVTILSKFTGRITKSLDTNSYRTNSRSIWISSSWLIRDLPCARLSVSVDERKQLFSHCFFFFDPFSLLFWNQEQATRDWYLLVNQKHLFLAATAFLSNIFQLKEPRDSRVKTFGKTKKVIFH